MGAGLHRFFGGGRRPLIRSSAFSNYTFALLGALPVPRFAPRPGVICFLSLFFPSFPYVLASLHPYVVLFAMHRVQRTPKRIQCLIRRFQNLFLVAAGVLFQPPTPSCAMRLVRFFMYLEIRQPLGLRHSV